MLKGDKHHYIEHEHFNRDRAQLATFNKAKYPTEREKEKPIITPHEKPSTKVDK